MEAPDTTTAIVTLAELCIGFSVLSAGILLAAYLFFLESMQKTAVGKAACSVLLLCLAGLQLFHWHYLATGAPLMEMRAYVVVLLATPPAFYFFSREIILPPRPLRWHDAIHLVPLAAGAIVPTHVVIVGAFVVGTAYSFWFVTIVFRMRRQVARFRFELFFFALFAVLAVLVLLLGILLPRTGAHVFYVAYALFIGIAMLLVTAALVFFPQLLSELADAAILAHSTTLAKTDVTAKCAELERLMAEEKLFRNEGLSLALCAAALGLSAHQLSELVNRHFGIGFSRYVREKRVAEAQRLLLEDPDVSVLAISLETGFRSQSNFYAAFREITGRTPAAWRRAALDRA